jgi:hypothetical protein
MYPEEPEEFGRPAPARPELPPKPSMAPSWVLLGFVIGAVFVWMLPRSPAPSALSLSEAPPPVAVAKTPPQIAVIEAVFAEWGSAAAWENDLTEVALWSGETKSYSVCFQVLRTGGMYFFRSIPRLTRPVLSRGVPDNSPLQLTESEAQRAEWIGAKNQETWRAISEAARNQASPLPPPTGAR